MMYLQRGKQYSKVIYLLFICIFFIIFPYLVADASDKEQLSIEFTYGFHGITKVDSCTPIHIAITNGGGEIKGRVQVIQSFVTPTNSTIETVLLNGYKEKNFMYETKADIASNGTTNISMIIPITSQINRLKILIYDEYDNIVLTSMQEIESDDYYYYVYAGILSNDSTVQNYFDNMALYQYNDYTFRAILLEDKDIPLENYGLDIFNLLITNQEELDQLSKEQQNVIHNWVKNGGFIVNLSNLSNLSNDISWERLVPESQLKKLEYSYRSYANWSITTALSNVFMNDLPSFTLYAIVISIYVILVGPCLYLVLKKLNKRKLFWGCELILSILFVLFIMALGANTRLKAPFINYFKIITYNEDVVDNSVYFNIRAPFNNDYKLYLDKDYSLKPIYEYSYYNDRRKNVKLESYNIGITKNEQENIIDVKNDVAFTKEYFYAEKSEDKSGNNLIRVDMNLFGDQVNGTITNHLEEPIENAAIVIYNKIIFLSTIPADSTIDLANMKIYTYNPKFKYGLTNEIAGLKVDKNGYIKDGYMTQNQKKTILDFYMDNRFDVYNKKAFLIGFTKDANQLELQLDSSYDAYGMTLIEVPVHANYSKDGSLYTSYVPIKNEEYSSSGDIMYTDEMILTYSLGKDLSDISIYFNDLSYYDEQYYKAFSGHIYFYNRNTTLYDPFDLSIKKVSAEALKPYLNEENEIVIKYVEQFDKEGKQALLPSLSTIGRVKDAGN